MAVKANKLQKVVLAIVERDARTGDYVLKAGSPTGDQVLRHPTALLKDNQRFKPRSAGLHGGHRTRK